MSDTDTSIHELRQQVADFIAARQWERFHTPKSLAMSIAIEAAELMEHFQWLSLAEASAACTDEATRAEVADELADVLIYCLSLANVTGIDISDAIRTKMARNETRFPATPEAGTDG